MQFTYNARNPNGQNQAGELVADSRDEAVGKLRQEGLHLLSLDEVENGSKDKRSVSAKTAFRGKKSFTLPINWQS